MKNGGGIISHRPFFWVGLLLRAVQGLTGHACDDIDLPRLFVEFFARHVNIGHMAAGPNAERFDSGPE
jgi:hypothetical protein